jgi:hypothetical protein
MNKSQELLDLISKIENLDRTTSELAAEYKKLGLGLTYDQELLVKGILDEYKSIFDYLKDK